MKMMSRVANTGPVLLADVTVPEFYGGLESGKFANQLEDVAKVLNRQAEWLNRWSESARKILLRPLVDTDDKDEDTGTNHGEPTNHLTFVLGRRI